MPRLTAYYGEYDYGYSNIVRPAAAMPDILEQLCQQVSEQAGVEFNAVLGNLYRNGQDSMGWHADDEPEIDQQCIASVSFGDTRRFRLKHLESGRSVHFDLSSGSLLLMENCQQGWHHALPKTQKQVGPRINLTFRRISPRLR